MAKFQIKSVLIIVLGLIAFSSCYDVKKFFKKAVGDMSREEFIKRLGINKSQTPKEKFFEFSKRKGDYNNCETRKDFELPDIFMFMPILKGKLFKPGDKVVVITGKDRGKEGKILTVLKEREAE